MVTKKQSGELTTIVKTSSAGVSDGSIHLRDPYRTRPIPSTAASTPQPLISLELIEKLAAPVPPPRLNLIRYHGVLAPNASARNQIVPAPLVEAPASSPPPPSPPRLGRIAEHGLLFAPGFLTLTAPFAPTAAVACALSPRSPMRCRYGTT